MKLDDYNTVINDEDTYDTIAKYMKEDGSLVFAWTDQQGTQLDLLFCYLPDQYGYLQRGMKSETDLFVAVSGWGMFGFALNGAWKSPGYVGSKLGLGDTKDTTTALAELINAVCERLADG